MKSPEKPRLRPLEAVPDTPNSRYSLRDPTQLAEGVLVAGQAELALLTLLDGTRGRLDIQGEYARRWGQILLSSELDALLEQLDGAGFLEGAGFERYYARRLDEYLSAPFRPLRDPNGFGMPATQLRGFLDDGLACYAREGRASGRLAGLVVPHLDFGRGLPCYGEGYSLLRASEPPRRVVVLGTNHFGSSRSVVATRHDFQTPWGVLQTDREFLARLEAECGNNLMPYELDHLPEHSVELHAVWLHHLLGDGVRIVPFLCPDPSGPQGTAPGDPEGVDLRQFALALGELVRRDPEPTLIVASADLSHVGGYFGDDRPLDEPFLAFVRERDDAGLAWIDRNEPEEYRRHMARTQNPTRVCSVGCLYAAMVALGPEAEAVRLRYHQAVTPEIHNAVSCAAYGFYA